MPQHHSLPQLERLMTTTVGLRREEGGEKGRGGRGGGGEKGGGRGRGGRGGRGEGEKSKIAQVPIQVYYCRMH